MANRKKLYYPENQIIRNQFTQGGEWMTIDDWNEYIGFYHSYTNGETFTEKEWNPIKSRKLVPYKKREESYFKYLELTQYTVVNNQKEKLLGPVDFSKYQAPRAVKRTPDQIEQKNGIMTRYFVYKRNEQNRVFFEIAKSQSENFDLDNEGINQYLYGLVEIPWKIDGPEFDVRKDGLLVTPGIVETNQRIVDRFSKKFPILKTILTNPREHSKYDR